MLDILPENYQSFSNEDLRKMVDHGYLGVNEHLYGHYYARFFFDNSANIILVFILLTMIQGIIIDRFRSLRESLQVRKDDQTYTCFICGIDR